jgi:hypothetical protein
MPDLVEYKTRTITRYIVTRYEQTSGNGVSSVVGEFDNADTAYRSAYAMAFAEREEAGLPPGDPSIQFPATSPAYPIIGAL